MNNRPVRGSAFKQTIPHVGRVSGLWLCVSTAAVIVASTSTYLLFSGQLEISRDHRSLVVTLIVQTLLLIAALLGLAIFTTHRVVGPWIAVHRVCQAVRAGDRVARLRLRADDPQLKPVEEELNAMLDELTGEPRAGSS